MYVVNKLVKDIFYGIHSSKFYSVFLENIDNLRVVKDFCQKF